MKIWPKFQLMAENQLMTENKLIAENLMTDMRGRQVGTCHYTWT